MPLESYVLHHNIWLRRDSSFCQKFKMCHNIPNNKGLFKNDTEDFVLVKSSHAIWPFYVFNKIHF